MSFKVTVSRDSYSYLYLPTVAGIILFAVGVMRTLETSARRGPAT